MTLPIPRPVPTDYQDSPGLELDVLFDQVCDLAEATDTAATAHIAASAPHAGHSTPASVAAAINASSLSTDSNNIAFIGDSLATGTWYPWGIAVSSPTGIPTSGVYIAFLGCDYSATLGGTGTWEFALSAGKMRWTAPGDSAGAWVTCAQGKFTLESGSSDKGLHVYVWVVPSADSTISVILSASRVPHNSGILLTRNAVQPILSTEYGLAYGIIRLGTGGAQSDIVAGLIPYFQSAAPGPGFDILIVGTNSVVNAMPANTIIGHITSIIDARTSIGRKMAVVGLHARYKTGTTPISGTELTVLLTVNASVMAYCDSCRGAVVYVDAYSATRHPDYLDGRPAANMLADEVHYGQLAGPIVGAAVISALRSLGASIYPRFPSSSEWKDFSTVGRMLGTSGTPGTRTTTVGGIPTGLTSSNTANVNSVMEVVSLSDHGGRALDVTYTSSGAASQYCRFYSNSVVLANLGLAVGDTIEVYAYCEILSSNSADSIYVLVNINGTSDGIELDFGSLVQKNRFISPRVKIPSGATGLQFYGYISTNPSGASAGQVRFADILVRKVE